jgi:hypothetical protein
MISKKWMALLLLLVLVLYGCEFSFQPPVNESAGERALSSNGWNTARYGDVLDVGTRMRYFDADPVYQAQTQASLLAQAAKINFDEAVPTDSESEGGFTFNGGTKYLLAYDSAAGYYFKTYTLRSVGEFVEVWVADDLAFPQEDRPVPVITQAQVDLLKDEFDTNIYPTDSEFFGYADSHDGTLSALVADGVLPPGYYEPADGIERTMLLVDNVRDESFYDPSYPFFIAGFYSSAFEYYMDRNVISLDSMDWEQRLTTTFFGTTAHEYQHLIHDDNDPEEETWLNEGMSDFAEYLCGYGHPMGHVNFFLDHPENSLVEWDDHYAAETGPETLADYGQAYLLQLYLYDKYGRDFTQYLAKSDFEGIAGVNDALAYFETGVDFEEIFRRFSLALVVDSYWPGRGIYEFDSIDVMVNFESAKTYDKEGVPAWGANYIEIEKAYKYASIEIDGIEYLPSPWTVVVDPFDTENEVLWGNEGDELANQLIFSADLGAASVLEFDHFFAIEEAWDYGFVQISTDGGQTFVSLENENTRFDFVPDGYPAIAANLPGFTGASEGWQHEVFDLSAYAGQEVFISFNYMTDWGYNDPGWYIDNVSVDGALVSDGSSTDVFMSIDEVLDRKVEYQLSFVNEIERRRTDNLYRVLSLEPFSVSEDDSAELYSFFRGGNNYMVVWYPAPEGVKGTVAYEYRLVTFREWARRIWEKRWRRFTSRW